MMPNPFAELPLAVFTTLMPLGAGCMIGLVVAALCVKADDQKVRALDKLTLVPLAILIVGFVAAFFHLSSPLHAVFALSAVGSSPLSSEILVAAVFVVVVLLYWVLARVGKMTSAARVVMATVVAVCGIGLAVFTGLAYYMPTIATWASPWAVLANIGYLLMGATLAALIAVLIQVPRESAFYAVCAAAVACGVLVAAISNVMLFAAAGEATGVVACGSALVAAAVPYLAAAAACALVCVACALVGMLKNQSIPLLAVASAALVIAVFCARLAFYCIQLGVGL